MDKKKRVAVGVSWFGRKTLLTALIAGAVLATASPAHPQSAGIAPSTGIPVCDEYLTKREACQITPQMTPEAQQSLKTGLDTLRRKFTDAGKSPLRSAVEDLCKQQMGGIKDLCDFQAAARAAAKAAAQSPATGQSTGIPVCDEYLRKREACQITPKMAPEARQSVKAGLDTLRRQYTDGGKSPFRSTVENLCKQQMGGLKGFCEVQAAATAPSATDPSADLAQSTGLPICDEVLRAFVACRMNPRTPPHDLAMNKVYLDSLYQQFTQGAQHPEVRSGLENICKAHLGLIKQQKCD